MSGRDALEGMVSARRRAEAISGLRRLSKAGSASRPAAAPAQPAGGAAPERCDLCDVELPADHRHLIKLTERSILCACESCVALRSGDAELRPVGSRIDLLEGFELASERWAALSIPIGLCFFLRSSTAGKVVAFYPSPAGATECELDLDAWNAIVADNPQLAELETDIEALVVDRIADPPRYAIAPIDECYRLVGMIKAGWDGISGGDGPEQAADRFFAELRARVIGSAA